MNFLSVWPPMVFKQYFLCSPAPALHHTERIQLLNSLKEQSPGKSFLYGLQNLISNVLPQWERIRIQGAKPMRIHADPVPSQTLLSQNLKFLHKYTL